MEVFVKEFEQEVQRNDEIPEAIIAIQSLIRYIEQSNVGTLQQLIEELQVCNIFKFLSFILSNSISIFLWPKNCIYITIKYKMIKKATNILPYYPWKLLGAGRQLAMFYYFSGLVPIGVNGKKS